MCASLRPRLRCASSRTFRYYAHAQFVLESGDNAGVDYWWNDYGMGGPGVGAFQLACWSNDSNPNPPKSYPHCMRCYDDDVDKKPALWNAFVRVSRRENHGQRGMVLGIYGGLGHHRYPVCCPPLRDWSFFRPLDQAVGSGDTFEDWKTLTFQIYLTLTAANVAVEWNHDLVIWLHDVPIRVACSTEVSQTL